MGQEPVSERIRHILVVEDSPVIAMDLESTLLDIGIGRVSLAASCEAALALVEGSGFDAALLDLFLGSETCLSVADALVARDIPFALVTGYGDAPEGLGRFPQVPVLRKPHREAELIAVLEQLSRDR